MMIGLGATLEPTKASPVNVTEVFRWVLYGIGGLFLWQALRAVRK